MHFADLRTHLEDLVVCAPPQGSLPGPTKSILIALEKNVPQENSYFRRLGIRVITGSCYLGGVIDNQAADTGCLVEKVHNWNTSMEVMARDGTQTPKDSIHWSAKFPPTGLVFCPEFHPWRQGGLSSCGGGTPTILPHIPFPW